MAIRCASKAIITNDGAILLNKCIHEDGRIYYDLPGGGQNVYESLEEALVREVKEETGYDVRVDKFVALAEEIYTSTDLRERFPEYTHRVFHIFKASLISDKQDAPTEIDFATEGSIWMPINELACETEVCPSGIKKLLHNWGTVELPCYLGTEYKE